MLHLDLRLFVRPTLLLLLGGFHSAAAGAEVWRSPLHEKSFLLVEKRPDGPPGPDGAASFAPLPADLVERLGADWVDYESFVAAYLPPAEAAALAQELTEEGWFLRLGIDRRVELPWHSFEAGETRNRTADFSVEGLTRPLPELFLLQFAYPIQERWLAVADGCGLARLATLQQRTILVRTRGLAEILACPIARYLSWIDSYRSTDRLPPAMLAEEAPLGYTLHFSPGTDLAEKAARLPGSVPALEQTTSENGSLPALHLQASRVELQKLVVDDPDLLSVTHRGILELSDERQGQIVAGNYNANGTVTSPGYLSWLASRGLLTETHQQVVGLLDSGYEDGSYPAGNHNPDLKNPYRLIAPVKFPPGQDERDRLGHATMVAGIIAGEGAVPFGAGGVDPQGFHYGSGISPKSRLVAAKIPTGLSLNNSATIAYLKEAVAYCRTDPGTGTDRALIVNNSYNSARLSDGLQLAVNEYDDVARAFDSLVLDGNPQLAGLQPTALVVSAGNYAYDYQAGAVRFDSVASPATAKNVISVGATTSYRPAPTPPLPCQQNPNGSRPPDQDAVHVSHLGLFSGNGVQFQSAGPALLHQVRIKPDLVAPGVRVFSTVPFNPTFYRSPVGCTKYYPDPPTEVYHHTYGTGTSFAAPVVSGAAALARKFFLDHGTNPSPSLLKAALIATADDLGGTDRRPSPRSGWGRVSLKRLTEPGMSSFLVNETTSVTTGESRNWVRQIGDPAKDIAVVLVWSDPPSALPGSSQTPLANDLSLTLELNGTKFPYWRGNNFRENKSGIDTGYSHRFQSVSDHLLIDSINNVEAIFVPANTFAAGQALSIKVRGENVTQGPQRFSVYAWNVKQNP